MHTIVVGNSPDTARPINPAQEWYSSDAYFHLGVLRAALAGSQITFEEARAHLGVETQRQWADKAILRTTPCLLALYSLVTLAARQLFSTGQLYRRCAAWYPKPQATFSDTIAAVRRELWSHAYFSISHREVDMVKIPRPLVDRFIDSLCYVV